MRTTSSQRGCIWRRHRLPFHVLKPQRPVDKPKEKIQVKRNINPSSFGSAELLEREGQRTKFSVLTPTPVVRTSSF